MPGIPGPSTGIGSPSRNLLKDPKKFYQYCWNPFKEDPGISVIFPGCHSRIPAWTPEIPTHSIMPGIHLKMHLIPWRIPGPLRDPWKSLNITWNPFKGPWAPFNDSWISFKEPGGTKTSSSDLKTSKRSQDLDPNAWNPFKDSWKILKDYQALSKTLNTCSPDAWKRTWNQ